MWHVHTHVGGCVYSHSIYKRGLVSSSSTLTYSCAKSLPELGVWVFFGRLDVIKPHQSSCLHSSWLGSLAWRGTPNLTCGCWELNFCPHDCSASAPKCWSTSLSLFINCVFETGSPYTALAVLELTIPCWPPTQRSSCFCLPVLGLTTHGLHEFLKWNLKCLRKHYT